MRSWKSVRLWLLIGGLSFPILGALDLDSDGLSDIWEILFRSESLLPAADEDGDNLSNFVEAGAGTNPRIGESRLGVYDVRPSANGLLFSWDGLAGKRYQLVGKLGVDDATWTTLSPVLPGATGRMTVDIVSDPLGLSLQSRAFVELRVHDVDSDSDGLTDWEELQLGLDPAAMQTHAGTNDAALASAWLVDLPELSLSLSTNIISSTNSATLTIQRSGGRRPVELRLAYGGSMVNGLDVELLPIRLELPFLVMETQLVIRATGAGFPEPEEDLTISIESTTLYNLAPVSTGRLVVVSSDPTLFAAQLRPAPDAFSPAAAEVVMAVAADQTQAELYPSIDGSMQLFFGPPENGLLLLSWSGGPLTLTPSLTAQLEAGQLWLRHVGSGLSGALLLADGGQILTAPASIPPQATHTNAAALARFLAQASFGPSSESIAALEQLGYAAWLEAQCTLPPSLHRPLVSARADAGLLVSQSDRSESWWRHAVLAPDQLRQRTAFALASFLVISDRGLLIDQPEGVADYYDVLVRHALGNYRDLLREVSLHPCMGVYLSTLRNHKAIPSRNVFPDENYAREVMQLFSIGLWKLHPDGSRIIGTDGQPIPTYGQAEVEETARVLTGWSFASEGLGQGFWQAGENFTEPMQLYPDQHDDGEKVILGGLVLPAGQGGDADMDDLVDALFAHPNTGPFVARRLIQRLVTANPSRAYVYRVAAVFANNGLGVRGDLGAVVKAILLDPEARSDAAQGSASRGSLREPLLRVSGLIRAFDGADPGGDYRITHNWYFLTQGPLQAGSVFHDFAPDFSAPGELKLADLVSPVFQMTSPNNAIKLANVVQETADMGLMAGLERVSFDLSDELALATDPAALLDHLSILLLHGPMPSALRNQILGAIIPMSDLDARVRTAIYLLAVSPEGVILK